MTQHIIENLALLVVNKDVSVRMDIMIQIQNKRSAENVITLVKHAQIFRVVHLVIQQIKGNKK